MFCINFCWSRCKVLILFYVLFIFNYIWLILHIFLVIFPPFALVTNKSSCETHTHTYLLLVSFCSWIFYFMNTFSINHGVWTGIFFCSFFSISTSRQRQGEREERESWRFQSGWCQIVIAIDLRKNLKNTHFYWNDESRTKTHTAEEFKSAPAIPFGLCRFVCRLFSFNDDSFRFGDWCS